MKKLVTGIVMILLVFSLILMGCQKSAELKTAGTPVAELKEEASVEETEISDSLTELEELDKLDQEFGSDVNFEEIETLGME